MPDPIRLETNFGGPADATGGQLNQGTRTVPILFDAYAGYQLVDPSNSYRLRFTIPPQISVIRRARLSFSLTSGVYVSQTGAVSAVDTAAGTSHNHTQTGPTGLTSAGHTHSEPAHQHKVAAATGAGSFGSSTYTTGDGALVNLGSNVYQDLLTYSDGSATSGAQSADHNHALAANTGAEAAHTHHIAGGAITLSPATALGQVGCASGAFISVSDPPGSVSFSLMTPDPPAMQPPYGGGLPGDYGPFDITKYITQTGVTYEIQVSTLTIGGIIAQLQLVAQLTES